MEWWEGVDDGRTCSEGKLCLNLNLCLNILLDDVAPSANCKRLETQWLATYYKAT